VPHARPRPSRPASCALPARLTRKRCHTEQAHARLQAGQFCELARRSVFPDTPPDQADRIRQTLDDWTLEIITRLADGEPTDDCRPDTSGFPAEWFVRPHFARTVERRSTNRQSAALLERDDSLSAPRP